MTKRSGAAPFLLENNSHIVVGPCTSCMPGSVQNVNMVRLPYSHQFLNRSRNRNMLKGIVGMRDDRGVQATSWHFERLKESSLSP